MTSPCFERRPSVWGLEMVSLLSLGGCWCSVCPGAHTFLMFEPTGPADGEDGRGQRPGSEDERRGPGSRLRRCTSGQQVSLSLRTQSLSQQISLI